MVDLERALRELSRERLIFHSEADFQHALAWRIHENCPDAEIRLERPLMSNSDEMHADIVVTGDGRTVPIGK